MAEGGGGGGGGGIEEGAAAGREAAAVDGAAIVKSSSIVNLHAISAICLHFLDFGATTDDKRWRLIGILPAKTLVQAPFHILTLRTDEFTDANILICLSGIHRAGVYKQMLLIWGALTIDRRFNSKCKSYLVCTSI